MEVSDYVSRDYSCDMLYRCMKIKHVFVFTFGYSYGFMFVMDYVCMYVCMYVYFGHAIQDGGVEIYALQGSQLSMFVFRHLFIKLH